MKDYEFTVVIERDEDGRYLAICPALQGCYTEGETEQEAWALIEDAIRLHVEDRQRVLRANGAESAIAGTNCAPRASSTRGVAFRGGNPFHGVGRSSALQRI